MNNELNGQIRTLLAAIGGAVVTNGWASDSTVQLATGIIAVVITAVWSLIEKRKGK